MCSLFAGVTVTRAVIITAGLGSGVVTTTGFSGMSFACKGVQAFFFATFAYLDRARFEYLSLLGLFVIRGRIICRSFVN